jgi:hypothetical protein
VITAQNTTDRLWPGEGSEHGQLFSAEVWYLLASLRGCLKSRP